ncbi:E3 ubiquitin-protein ligase rnf8-A isoform X2 [Bombyx mori]|uniref:E3 ubiquitin-protein ligase CHFR n=1 Tax=Bombyx mori TaxID=7091 RepID=A0A8R2C5S4_BOMMO|nr:E3 ubiquitin-protein ligase rnf8-A isoform X1 [Bombyx mori]
MNDEILPKLITCKPLKDEFNHLNEIHLSSNEFSVGRATQNEAIIPFLSISRNHCIFKKTNDNDWTIEDRSTFGIEINGTKLGKGKSKRLYHQDIINLEPSGEFLYRYIHSNDDFETPRKRFKIEKSQNTSDGDIAYDVKVKFEASQKYEIEHIEDKIQNAKQMQTTSLILKQQLELDMDRQIQQLKNDYASQIENLQGEKDEVEKQKVFLIEQRDAELTAVRKDMEGKISELMDQIQRHNETEAELMTENSLLKEKLLKEREEFICELNRESSSKQDMLMKLETKIKEQEEIRYKEKIELEQMLKKETEQLRIAKEKELKELEEQKLKRERELEQELVNIKQNLQEQVKQTEEQRIKALQDLNRQKEEMKKLSEGEKAKMEQLIQEREEIQLKLQEAQTAAEKSLADLQIRVQTREIELAALAAERIQQQADHSSEVIKNLQNQLEMVKNQLQSVETEKKKHLNNSDSEPIREGSSTQTFNEVGEVMESELQCSICAELFVKATTLNCSHTFCLYCISMWKKKKKDCPICRTSISTECKSLVLDTFIERMVQKLPEETKLKRKELLKSRQELESEADRSNISETDDRRNVSFNSSETSDSEIFEEEEEEEYNDYESDDDNSGRIWVQSSDSDDRFDDDFNFFDNASEFSDSDSDFTLSCGSETGNDSDGVRRLGVVAGRPGSYYGGYGRCYKCGCRGHWLPGCPF